MPVPCDRCPVSEKSTSRDNEFMATVCLENAKWSYGAGSWFLIIQCVCPVGESRAGDKLMRRGTRFFDRRSYSQLHNGTWAKDAMPFP